MVRSAKKILKGHATRQAGFTLLEVMISLVVLGVGLLLLSGAQLTTTRGNASGFKMTEAVSLAENGIQELQTLDFLDPALAAAVHSHGDITSHGNVVFSRNYTVSDNDPIAGVKGITYTVSWQENGPHAVTLFARTRQK
jgi:type IV pilus assembly protein PilV